MNRILSLAGIVVAVFMATVTILLFLLPGPHAPTDYLVIGAVATLLCLLLLFVLLVKMKPKS